MRACTCMCVTPANGFIPYFGWFSGRLHPGLLQMATLCHVCSYNQALPVAEDYIKEPPPAPAHLQLTLLNVPPALGATASLPRPQHVILNHIYCQRATHQARTLHRVIGLVGGTLPISRGLEGDTPPVSRANRFSSVCSPIRNLDMS